jgi:branched-chain amino acid transport system substrate-binding protein
MTLKRISIIATICLFCLGLMVSPTMAFKGTYKVGAVFSATGRTSFLGDPEKKTAEMIAEEINKAGGINGHKLELIVYDTEGDATKCNLAVKKLITQDKVCAVIVLL